MKRSIWVQPKLSDFWESDVLRSCSSRACANRRHTHGYVEDWHRPLMGDRWVQRESKITQFRLKIDHLMGHETVRTCGR